MTGCSAFHVRKVTRLAVTSLADAELIMKSLLA